MPRPISTKTMGTKRMSPTLQRRCGKGPRSKKRGMPKRGRQEGRPMRVRQRSRRSPHTIHLTPYTLHLAPYTLHPTPYTLHPTSYTKVRRSEGYRIRAGSAEAGHCPPGNGVYYTAFSIGTSRVHFVVGSCARWELKAIDTRAICPLAIRARGGLGAVG